MGEATFTDADRISNSSVGHLSIHVDGSHPVDVPFLFEERQKRLGPALLLSLAYHVGIFALLVIAVRYGPGPPSVPAALLPERVDARIIWLSEPGPGGGGGGGGNRMQEPPRPAELPGKDKLSVPVSKPPKLEPPKQAKEPDPVEQLNIPAKSLAAATESLPGAIEAPQAPPSTSQGTGAGGGAGTGDGSGIGPGAGSGLGPGSGGGTGGGVYRPGNGVTLPRLLREVKPDYTTDAMRAKVQGTVLLECVVNINGEVEQIKVVRSLDQTFGLDQQAIKAAKQWRFAPATRLGQPVAVLVTIELSFTLR
jgi:periplasmic protein TonB